MTARTLTAPQRRALLWLAERPGAWCNPGREHGAACSSLRQYRPDLVDQEWRTMTARQKTTRNCFRLTPAGIQAAKEIADAVA